MVMESEAIQLNINTEKDNLQDQHLVPEVDRVKRKAEKHFTHDRSPDGSSKKLKVGPNRVKIKNNSKQSSESLVSLVSKAKYSGNVHSATQEDVTPIEEPLFSSHSFEDVEIHPYMVSNLKQTFGITQMTEVQRLSIPELCLKKDALIKSQTGSGKTLAYAIPIVNMLQSIRPKLKRDDGTRVLVVLPTRELAIQTYECFQKLVRSFAWLVPGYLVGGEKRKSEKARLRRGITILVGTPGRLLDHCEHTKTLSFHNLSCLVLDEADMLLDMNYEKDVTKLIEIIESHRDEQSRLINVERRQTILLSATLTHGVERLAKLALSEPQRIDTADIESDDFEKHLDLLVIPESLSQHFIVCPTRLRLVTLTALLTHFIQEKDSNKILVFMATQDMVDYHTSLLQSVVPSIASFFQLRGNMAQIERVEVFKKFRSSASGVLICTDVGARGLDLPKVNCIIQYTAPCSPSDYVHRVGRTARVGNVGSAVLFLAPAETTFLDILSSKRLKVDEYDLGSVLDSILKLDLDNGGKKIRDLEDAASLLQLMFEKAVLEEKQLHNMAAVGYKSFVRFYASYRKEYRKVFNFKSLHLGHYAKSFALRDAPSRISGIGKPAYKKNKEFRDIFQKGSSKSNSEFKKPLSQTMSEYDSGIEFKKKS